MNAPMEDEPNNRLRAEAPMMEFGVAANAVHPMIGSLIGSQSIEVERLELDSPDQIYNLEKEYRAAQFLRLWYLQPDLTSLERALAPLYAPMHAVDSIGNQFAKKIVPCFLEEDREKGREQFRAVVPNTTNEELALLLNDEQFDDLHGALSFHLEDAEDDIRTSTQANLDRIAKTDSYQFSNVTHRGIDRVLETGMVISIDPSGQEAIRDAGTVAGEGILPVTEYLKNDKILGVSGFMGSKISLAVHDFMDHVWTFDMIKKAGLLDQYAELFDSVGNPDSTDIFKREGEMVASIAFGVRYFQTMPSAFGPMFRSSKIEEHLDELFVRSELDARHMGAYRTIKALQKGSMEWQSLGFAFSNYLTELDEQRRKYGAIKQRDPRSKKLIGELDPFSPDYMCFFIDTHSKILSSKNKHRDDLFRFHILLEEYLSSYAKGLVPLDEPVTVHLGNLRDIDFTKTTLPPKRIQWMANNYGFTATRDAIV